MLDKEEVYKKFIEINLTSTNDFLSFFHHILIRSLILETLYLEDMGI